MPPPMSLRTTSRTAPGAARAIASEARRNFLGAAGVKGGEQAMVAGVGGLQHVQDLWASDLADDDAVGAHAQGVANQLAERDLASALDVRGASLEPDDVGTGQIELGGIFDRDDALPFRDGSGEHVEQCDAAGARWHYRDSTSCQIRTVWS
jgi:hypothetical protein